MLNHASPALRCFILLCSDLAIRSGTAVKITPRNYDPEAGALSFTTKKGAAVTLPVTKEIRTLFESASRCPVDTAYVAFLGVKKGNTRVSATLVQSFKRLLAATGLDTTIRPHDFRRTTAVRVLEATGDIRQVQAVLGHKRLANTVVYLDHDLTRVSRECSNWRSSHHSQKGCNEAHTNEAQRCPRRGRRSRRRACTLRGSRRTSHTRRMGAPVLHGSRRS